jgi:hypothetical protein
LLHPNCFAVFRCIYIHIHIYIYIYTYIYIYIYIYRYSIPQHDRDLTNALHVRSDSHAWHCFWAEGPQAPPRCTPSDTGHPISPSPFQLIPPKPFYHTHARPAQHRTAHHQGPGCTVPCPTPEARPHSALPNPGECNTPA